MTTYKHPNAASVIVSTRLESPNPGIPRCVLVVEATIPLSDKIAGYDATELQSLIDFVLETMENVQAKEAEIYPLSEPGICYIVRHDAGQDPSLQQQLQSPDGSVAQQRFWL
jgi:hypothetical protein